MKRFVGYAVIAFLSTAMVSSCGKDDDNEPDNNSALMPIPVSVVDGVRVTSVTMGNTDFSKFIYNPDGSVASVTMNGATYVFEYESTRATSLQYTNSKLSRVVITNEEGKSTGYGFSFDDNTGFVTRWYESREYSEGPYYEKATATFNPVYNMDGRISELKFSGKLEWNDPDDGKGSESSSGIIHYNYKGTNLVSSTYDIPDEGKSVFTLGYGNGPLNNFNMAFYPLSYAMGHGEASLVAGVLASLGYLGYPSSSLPTSLSYSIDGYEYTNAAMTYQTNSIGKVTSMDMSSNGSRPITFNIGYNK